MRRLFYVFIVAIVAIGCQNSERGFTISGTFEGEDAMSAIRMSEGIINRDSTIDMKSLSDKGEFSFSGRVTTPYMVQLSKSGGRPVYGGVVIVEGGDIKITVNDDMAMVASGTKLNDRYNKLVDEFAANYEQTRELPTSERAKRFNEFVNKKIGENLDNPLGLLLLQDVAIREQKLGKDAVMEYLTKFSPAMQSSNDAKTIRMEQERKAALDYGAPYIDVTLTDNLDDEIAISSLVGEGKWVLIDFWATWCGPCMAEMPSLLAVYEEYSDYGFEICGISIDSDSQTWRRYCNENLPWVNLFAGHSDVAKLYQIRSVPTNFLISPEGKIVDKNLRGDGISATLAKYIKK